MVECWYKHSTELYMVYYSNICCKKNGCDTSVKLKEWFGLLSTYASLALVDKFGCNFFIQSFLHHMKMFTEKLEQTFFCPQYIWNCQCLIGVIKDCNMCVCVCVCVCARKILAFKVSCSVFKTWNYTYFNVQWVWSEIFAPKLIVILNWYRVVCAVTDPYVVRNIKMQTVLPISHASLLTDGPALGDNICVNERFNLVSFDLLAGCIFCYTKHALTVLDICK